MLLQWVRSQRTYCVFQGNVCLGVVKLRFKILGGGVEVISNWYAGRIGHSHNLTLDSGANDSSQNFHSHTWMGNGKDETMFGTES